MEIYEIKKEFSKLSENFNLLKNKLNLSQVNDELEKLGSKINDPNFWSNNNEATIIIKEHQALENELKILKSLINKIEELTLAIELFEEKEIDLQQVNEEYEKLELEFKKFEINTLLSEEFDGANAFVEIHPGAGGTESQDWANMIFEMYKKYFNKAGYTFVIIAFQSADVGIKSVLIEVKGLRAYGMLKGESGIHRLVRISPFDSNAKRHTSFCSVSVMPELEDNTNINIKDNDLKIDVYRSSGAGGQSVNTTDSAVRITHLPTGIVVTCQNQRSQVQNKEQGLKVLKGKLVELQIQENRIKKQKIAGIQKEIGWGSQKRSYVLHPYKMVKDNYSGYETNQAEKVLSGELEELLYYNLVPLKGE